MKTKRMILAGGRGYMGHLLRDYFETKGWECLILTRATPTSGNEIHWDGEHRGEWEQVLEGAEVVINLCGKSVNCRYTAQNRKLLMDSRLKPTRLVGEVLSEMKNPPAVWMNASTATLYRHTFGDPWTEDGEIGSHPDAKDAFSIELAEAWEEVFMETIPPGVRPVLLRSAMVLGRGRDPNNVLRVLGNLTRAGLGGKMGHGKQFVSWIHEQDLCRAVEWILDHPRIEGPVNTSSPTPLTNQEMMRILRQHVHRPIGLPAPAWALELGAFFLRTETELIIKSRRVIPGKLQEAGFHFEFPYFNQAVEDLI